ncbi:MAG: hypothetical protein NVV83_11080 [Afipia sp.]|jgi:hypothetical protein|nr:hypothetical protein [Afipia sp.]
MRKSAGRAGHEGMAGIILLLHVEVAPLPGGEKAISQRTIREENWSRKRAGPERVNLPRNERDQWALSQWLRGECS